MIGQLFWPSLKQIMSQIYLTHFKNGSLSSTNFKNGSNLAKDLEKIMQAVGNTPLIKLSRLPGKDSADVYVKWEGANPTGSMKDRMAPSIVEGAERAGRLNPGGSLVEYTGGSTGSSLAMVCATRGYRTKFVSSNGFSKEKIQTMRAYGAEVEIVHAENGVLTAGVIDMMIARAKELAQDESTFWPDQVNNPNNKLGYHGMGREILEQLDRDVDEFVMVVGGADVSRGCPRF